MKALFSTSLTRLLSCRHPVLCAGMGGPARAELVAAVSDAGGFGLLGMVRATPQMIDAQIAAVRALTGAPFGVNLIPTGTDAALLDAELDACLNARVAAMCFFWGSAPGVDRARETGQRPRASTGRFA